jgi:hypothetical protein
MSQTSQDAVFQEKSDDEGENGELLAINPGKPRFALSSSVCFVFLRKGIIFSFLSLSELSEPRIVPRQRRRS